MRELGIDRKATAGVDHVFVAQVQYHQVVVHGAAALQLILKQLFLALVQIDALLEIIHCQNLLDRVVAASIDQAHHQLVVGNTELAKAAQAGS